MSGLITGLVLEQPITAEFTSEMKFVAVILADHAWQDGTHAHPAVATVAAKTGYHERSVQRYLRGLELMGLLVPDGKGPHGTNQYRFPLAIVDGAPRLQLVPPAPLPAGGDSLPPRQPATGDTDSGDTDSGDTGVTRINQPSLVVVVNAGAIFKTYEGEIGALTAFIRDKINDWLDKDHYPPDWCVEAIGEAARQNHRSLAYVDAILKNWQSNGRGAKPQREARTNGNHSTGDHKRTEQNNPIPAGSPADLEAARRVLARRAEKAGARL